MTEPNDLAMPDLTEEEKAAFVAPRVWVMPEIPADPEVGTRVRDRDGDEWTRARSLIGDGWSLVDTDVYAMPWTVLLSLYGPLTEIRDQARQVPDGQ
jgi:hypothetical protein